MISTYLQCIPNHDNHGTSGLRLAALGGTQVAFHDGALFEEPEVTDALTASCLNNKSVCFWVLFDSNIWV